MKGGKLMKRMWEFKQSAKPDTLELYIYGDVTAMEYNWNEDMYEESENSAKHFKEELSAHPNVKQINIYINSYGGSVFEGTAIYTQLRRHSAQKTVYIDGFACSVAAVIAMAGDKVIMPKNTMMMLHNAWSMAIGNAKELRKIADALDTIMTGNRQAFMQKAGDNLSEEKLVEMLDDETWLTAQDCIKYGLADEYGEKDADMSQAKQMLQKVNMTISQHIQFNKSLSAQLREINQSSQSAEPKEPAPPQPQENKPIKFLNALLSRKD